MAIAASIAGKFSLGVCFQPIPNTTLVFILIGARFLAN